jgi:hypothetical protein
MAAALVIGIYVVIGAAAAIVVFVRTPTDGKSPLLMLILWPFLLPARLFGETLPAPIARGQGDRLGAITGSLRDAFDHARTEERERRIVEAHVARIRSKQEMVKELEAAMAAAPPAVRAKLERIRARSVAQIDRGIGMLEEMVAQLLVLRFSSLTANEGDERQRMEDLMARIEALSSLSEEEEERAA